MSPRFAEWLGYWDAKFDDMRTQVEIVLQAKFDVAHSTAMGHEPIVQALRELHKFEEAIGGNKGDPGEGW